MIVSEFSVRTALPFLEDASIRIAVIHHPFEWLHEPDRQPVELAALQSFDVVMHGHVHTSFPEGRVTTLGSTIISQAGCLYESTEYPNSYQLLDISSGAPHIQIHVRKWDDAPRGSFGPAASYGEDGLLKLPIMLRSVQAQSPANRVLTLGRGLIRKRANEQVSLGVPGQEHDIAQVFVCPPLAERHQPGTLSQEGESEATKASETAQEVQLSDLLGCSRDIAFLGARESGKTTLGHFISFAASENKSDRPRVPAIIDMQRTPHANDMARGIKAYYTYEEFDPSEGQLLSELHDSYSKVDFLVILDNFSPRKPLHISALRRMKSLGERFRFVLLCDEESELITSLSRVREILPDASYITIRPLPRRLIRELSRKRLLAVESADMSLVDFVVNQFSNKDLPRTGYIVSLLLWISQSKLKVERLNEVELLRALIDHLLEKADFTQAIRGNFDSTLKELLLQRIAARLREKGGCESSEALLAFLKAFLAQKGLAFDAIDVLNVLCESGLLRRYSDTVSFRYRCFEEYFHALYVLNNEGTFLDAHKSENLLAYGREIDFITALRRQSKGFDSSIKMVLEEEFRHALPNGKGGHLKDLGWKYMSFKIAESAVPILNAFSVTQEMLDDFHDEAECKRLERTNAERGLMPKSDTGASEPAGPASSSSINGNVAAILLRTILLAKIIPNAEFEDLSHKIEFTRYTLVSLVKVVYLISLDLTEMITKAAEAKGEKDNLRQAEREARVNLAKVILAGIASLIISEAMVSSNLVTVLDTISGDENESLDLRMLAGFILADLNRPVAFHHLRRALLNSGADLHLMVAYIRLIIRCFASPNAATREQIIELIADIETKLLKTGQSGRLNKGARMQQLARLARKDQD